MPALRSVHRLWRAVLTAALLIAAALAPAPAAQAAPSAIAVYACNHSDDYRTDAWVRSASTGQPVDFIDRCGTATPASVGNLDTTGAFGFNAAPDSGALTAQPGRIAGYTLTAPTDTTITTVVPHYAIAIANDEWEIRVRAGGVTIATCAGPTTATKCADGLTDRTDAPITIPADTKTLDIGVFCVAAVQCTYLDGPNPTFSLVIDDATVTVADTTPPIASTPTASGQIAGRLTAQGLISAGGSDPSGIRTVEVLDGTKVVGRYDGDCVDWSMRPCAEASIGAGSSIEAVFTVAELTLASGSHTLRTRVIDAAGNETLSDPITVIIDETVGSAVSVTGGGRSNKPLREVRWLVPPGMIVIQSKIEVCNIPTAFAPNIRCQLLATSADDYATFLSDAFPNVTVRVRLTSAGGAVTYSEPVDYIHDTTVPKQPKVKLVESTGDLRVVELVLDPDDTDLASYTAHVCPMPSNRCAPLSSGPLPTDGSPVRVSTRLTSLANVRIDISTTDVAGNTGFPGQITLSPTASELKIKANALPMAIVPKLPARLPKKSSMVVKGATQPGAAARVLVTIAGRNKKGKAVKVQKVAKIAAETGAFAVRIALPKKLNRKKGLLITIDAAPKEGWLPAKTRTRLKG